MKSVTRRLIMPKSGPEGISLSEEIAIYKRAIRARWEVSQEKRDKVIRRLEDIIEDENARAQHRIQAANTLATIVAQQAQQDLAVMHLELKVMDHERLASYESLRTQSFAEPIEVELVTDKPMESIEHKEEADE
jgi:hypothetical protein